MLCKMTNKTPYAFTTPRPDMRRRTIAIATMLVFAAFVARVAGLDRSPLHYDEAINVFFGVRSPAEVLDWTIRTYDNNPPGHRFTLGLWMNLVGPTPFAIRVLSVLFGVLTVAALYRLARQLHLPVASALVAAGFVAISPFAVQYTQQAKGYAMGAGLTAVSWLAWVWMFRHSGASSRRQRAAPLVYITSTALALSTHYYVIPLLAMQWMWLAGTRLSGAMQSRAAPIFKSVIVRAMTLQVLAGLPMAIWLSRMAGSLLVSTARSSTKFEPPAPATAIQSVMNRMSVGEAASAEVTTLGALLAFALSIAGALRLWQRADARGQRPAFWFGASLALLIAGSIALQQRVTFFETRFLLYALPSLFVLIAGLFAGWDSGVTRPAARILPPLALASLAILNLAGLISFYRAPSNYLDGFRALLTRNRALFKENDILLGTYIWMEGMMTSYAPETSGRVTWHPGALSLDSADDSLATLARAHPRIWVLEYGGNPEAPDNPSIHWLRTNAALASQSTAGDATLLLFDATYAPARNPAVAATRRVTFSNGIQLDYAPVARTADLGDSIPLLLTWKTPEPLAEHLFVFTHLISPDGQLVAQSDGDPINGLAPSFTWMPGVPIVSQQALMIREALTPGDYTLWAGLYRADDGSRILTTAGADAVKLGVVTIQP